jgi:hypothetical protein
VIASCPHMPSDSLAYYRSGLALLKHVEARQPTSRRFGAEADALWSQVRGELSTLDRIDVLLRDADAQWPGAFGARTVFHLSGVAEDEPFGAQWVGISGIEAENLWRAQDDAHSTQVQEVLGAMAAAWQISLLPIDVGIIAPADRLVVVGPSAIASLIQVFAGNPALDWADQVSVIATPPSARQLAAAASAVLGSTKASSLVDSSAADTAAEAARLQGKSVRLVQSADATPEDRAAAERVARTR